MYIINNFKLLLILYQSFVMYIYLDNHAVI